MVLQYTVATAAEWVPKIGYALKAKQESLVQSSASFIMRSGLESTYAIKEAWSNLTSKALFHTGNFVHTEIKLYITLFSMLIKLMHT